MSKLYVTVADGRVGVFMSHKQAVRLAIIVGFSQEIDYTNPVDSDGSPQSHLTEKQAEKVEKLSQALFDALEEAGITTLGLD